MILMTREQAIKILEAMGFEKETNICYFKGGVGFILFESSVQSFMYDGNCPEEKEFTTTTTYPKFSIYLECALREGCV